MMSRLMTSETSFFMRRRGTKAERAGWRKHHEQRSPYPFSPEDVRAAAAAATARWRRGGVVVEVRAQPALDLLERHLLAQMVIQDLIALDLAEAEVARLRMGEIEAAHAGARPH